MKDNTEKMFPMSAKLLNQIVQYLGNRPFVEVWQLLEGIKATTTEVQKSESNVVTLNEVTKG